MASNSRDNSNTYPATSRAGYTDEEKKYLNDHFKSEYHFLRNYFLSIYKDEDREEGRAILRALMRADVEEDEDDSDLDGHMADYHFTDRQLSFIKKEYGNSMNFMLSYGLKFYDDDDCEEAKAIIRGIMAHS